MILNTFRLTCQEVKKSISILLIFSLSRLNEVSDGIRSPLTFKHPLLPDARPVIRVRRSDRNLRLLSLTVGSVVRHLVKINKLLKVVVCNRLLTYEVLLVVMKR